MNRVVNFAMAALVSSIAFANVSHADSLAMNDGPVIEKTLRTFDSPFDVKNIADYHNAKTGSDAEDTNIPRTPEGVKNIQAAIKENKALSKKFEAKGIDVRNVVNAQQAADGSMTFWLR